MTKGNITISIDMGLKEKLQQLYPNEVSTKINDYLHRLVAYSSNDLLKIDKIKLIKEIQEIESKITQMDVKKSFLQERLDQITELEKVEESKQQEKEEEEAMKKTMCAVCLIPKPNDKMHKFPGGLVCKGCFLDSANKKKIKQLNLRGGESDTVRHLPVFKKKQNKMVSDKHHNKKVKARDD